MTKPILTQEYLKECLHYDPETGIFTWLPRSQDRFSRHWLHKTWNSNHAGKQAGTKHSEGYLQTTIDRRIIFLHRAAFLYMTGEIPGQIDHINHDRSDNRWANLRATNHQDNQRNIRLPKRNKSGYIGVRYIETSGRWNARIEINKKGIHLGNFETKEEAANARKAAEIKYGFHENHGAHICQ